MENSNSPENSTPQQTRPASIWRSIGYFISLIWSLATEGLQMLLNTLKDIPPIVIGLMSATLLFWLGLTLITNDATIRMIFAIALSLLALGALGLVYLQKVLDYKKDVQKEARKRREEEVER
ncbi:MAG: hypothetical protein HY842_00780 [Bacteroidetes bacterium]|nr:hypothetical protein [Bacteroidota bacterium]